MLLLLSKQLLLAGNIEIQQGDPLGPSLGTQPPPPPPPANSSQHDVLLSSHARPPRQVVYDSKDGDEDDGDDGSIECDEHENGRDDNDGHENGTDEGMEDGNDEERTLMEAPSDRCIPDSGGRVRLQYSTTQATRRSI